MESKLIPGEVLVRELQKQCHVSESLIRMIIQREPHLLNDTQWFKVVSNEVNQLIEFMYEYFNNQIFDKLSSKISIVRDNQVLLWLYLVKWQEITNKKYRDVKFENQIDILFKQAPFAGTRFEVFDFTLKNLLMNLTPEEIVNIFLNQNQVFNLHWDKAAVGSPKELNDIIEVMAVTRAWLNSNTAIFGTQPHTMIAQALQP